MAVRRKPRRVSFRNGLSFERLVELLDYNPNTGVFYWKRNGKIAGYRNGWSYISIRIDGILYLAHRLAFLYITKKWPADKIDHRDGNRGNNRWKNLRPATNAQNLQNSKLRINNKSGFKGVSFVSATSTWYACIMVKGKSIALGAGHKTAKSAYAAYCAAALKFHGEFARLK